ncbi:MAG: SgcJ/EcaC family oxidoreductase [Luteolibacter sp.]
MKTASIIVLIALSTAGFCAAQDAEKESAPVSPEMAAVAANDRAYEAAYAKGDTKAVLNFYTEDVSYTSEDGQVLEGRAALEASLSAAAAANKGAKLKIHLDSVKVLAPEVVVEKGSSTVISKNGDEASSLFTAVHVKKDGKWKISQLVETPAPVVTAGEHLSELEWLIGDWNEADKDAGVTVRSSYQAARGGNFITRNVTVKRGDEPVLEGWQIIGWNPVDESIRSWTFDNEGGFTDGRWTRDGQRWLVREIGYTSDGSRTTADNTLTKADPDRLFWESSNRTLDGEPQPGIGRIEINRVKGE